MAFFVRPSCTSRLFGRSWRSSWSPGRRSWSNQRGSPKNRRGKMVLPRGPRWFRDVSCRSGRPRASFERLRARRGTHAGHSSRHATHSEGGASHSHRHPERAERGKMHLPRISSHSLCGACRNDRIVSRSSSAQAPPRAAPRLGTRSPRPWTARDRIGRLRRRTVAFATSE